jgi:hypothetical protein
MKVGSIVECINDSFSEESKRIILILPKKGKLYTIRNIIDYSERNSVGVLLEEIVNEVVFLPNLEGVFEPTFNINRFREIETMDIEELTEILELTEI